MKVRIYLAIGFTGICLGCGPASRFHNGDYARAVDKQMCYDSEGAEKAVERAVLTDDEKELVALEAAHGVEELHYNNRVRVVEQSGVHAKVQLDNGQQCWTYNTDAYLNLESPNDLPPTPLSQAPSNLGRH